MKVNGEITNELMTWLKRKNLIIKVQVLIETDNIEKVIPKSKFISHFTSRIIILYFSA